ncbi:MAG: putative glycoside hydrolase [Candidatus Bipolaricaulia bacterium]
METEEHVDAADTYDLDMTRTKSLSTLASALTIITAIAFFSAERTAPPASASNPGSGRVGVYLTSHALAIPEVVRGFLEAREAGKLDALVINVKNMHGEVTYATEIPLARRIGAAAERIDFTLLLPELQRRGFYLIARQVVFFDPLLAAHLGRTEDWIPADDETATAYNLAIAEEVATFGFDEIQFDYIRFEDDGELLAAYEERYEAVENFLAEASRRLAGRVALSADLFGRVLWPWNERRIDPIGQSLEGVCPHVDYVSPMLYPSHYVEETYQNDPYRVVMDALTGARERVVARFRPFLQAFDMRLPTNMALETYIKEQIRAANDAGADGYLFWHPACDYTALYNVL